MNGIDNVTSILRVILIILLGFSVLRPTYHFYLNKEIL